MLSQVLIDLNAKLDNLDAEYSKFKFHEAGVKATFSKIFLSYHTQALLLGLMIHKGDEAARAELHDLLQDYPVYRPESIDEVRNNRKEVDAFIARVIVMQQKFRAEKLSSNNDLASLEIGIDLLHHSEKQDTAIVPTQTRVYTPMLEGPPAPDTAPASEPAFEQKPKSDPPQETQKGQTTEKGFGGFAKGFLM
ncbi:MAG: hypothetical protein ACHQJ6_00170 [Candidatus Berkiellales bacterium]